LWVSDIVNKYQNSRSAYFLQDYESWFFPESDPKSRKAVIDTYGLIDNKIVKSEWLRALVAKDGYGSKKIHLGLDLGIFYTHRSNRQMKNYNHLTIVAMARPRTARRGFITLNKALELIKISYPNTEIILFGDDLSNYEINYEFENVGIVTSASDMASLHSRADIFIDSSDFQGFGRTALEAMACDCCCILTEVGGVTEYAKNNVNCLLVPPKDPKSIFEAFQSIHQSELLSERIRREAIVTANEFSHKREAINTLSYFEKILTKQ
jgi:glycosyltransferase involved in cell wall biosynthesis